MDDEFITNPKKTAHPIITREMIAYLTRDAGKPWKPERDDVYDSRPYTPRPTPAVMTIYFIQSAAGPIKIGRASRLSFRLRDLQLMSPVPLEVAVAFEGPPKLELEYHRRFKPHRLHGEWFSPHPEIINEIDRLKALKGEAI